MLKFFVFLVLLACFTQNRLFKHLQLCHLVHDHEFFQIFPLSLLFLRNPNDTPKKVDIFAQIGFLSVTCWTCRSRGKSHPKKENETSGREFLGFLKFSCHFSNFSAFHWISKDIWGLPGFLKISGISWIARNYQDFIEFLRISLNFLRFLRTYGISWQTPNTPKLDWYLAVFRWQTVANHQKWHLKKPFRFCFCV